MAAITVHPDRDTPLAEQIAAALRRAIATGELRVGDELPPVRQLAADLSVNLNTVARAYQVLAEGGLIHAARGRGTRVVGDRVSTPAPGAATPLVERCRDLVADAKLAGLTADRVREMVEEALRACFPDAAPSPRTPQNGELP